MNGITKAIALIAMLAFASPAFANDCKTAIADLDQKISEANVSAEILKEVQIMRMQADQMCQAGQDTEATTVAQEAGALLSEE